MKAERIYLQGVAWVFLISTAGCGPQPVAPGAELKPLFRRPELTPVTQLYGPLVVREGEFDVESPTKPWSSWWYPLRDPYLFAGTDQALSPLQKYDLYSKRVHQTQSQSAEYEKKNIYDPAATGWEGLCNAWAAASILEPEPTRSARVQGIDFGVGDLKALLVKSYEILAPLHSFGQRYNGDRESLYDDIYPDQFHKLVQSELFEKGRPFIMDKDPGLPVWNTPVWKAQFRIEPDATDPHLLHVTAWLVGASPFVPTYDYVGTLPVAFEYTYDLYGNRQPDGSFHVVYGLWTGASEDYHPDFLTVLPEKVERSSNNRELREEWIDEILVEARKM